MDKPSIPSLSDQLDTVQSGITDAYEALCELADAGDAQAEALATKLREAFAVTARTVYIHVGNGLLLPRQRTVVGAVDAMRPEPEYEDGPHVADGIEAWKAMGDR